jgi:lipopolysaccharide transport system permease protein
VIMVRATAENGRAHRANAGQRPFTVLRPAFTAGPFDFHDAWAHRELFSLLVWRLIIVRYKETVVGIAWAVLQPLGLMAVMVVFFGVFTRIPSSGAPYPLFVYAALIVWQFCSQGFTQGTFSVVNNAPLVTKIYFPRSLLPAASVAVNFVDLLLSFPALVILMAWYHVWPTAGIVLFLPMLGVAALLTLGLALLFSCLNVFYRDIAYVLPFLTQIWMFSSPIIYPPALVPEGWRFLYALNPLVGVIETARWSFAGGPPVRVTDVVTAVAVALAVFVVGLRFFHRREAIFADII